MATIVGAQYLQKTLGGRGVLMGGVPGVLPANVVVLGAGVVGLNATYMAVGMGADITVMDINMDRIRYIDDLWGNRVRTLTATATTSSRPSTTPTSSSAACCCRALAHRTSSPPTWCRT